MGVYIKGMKMPKGCGECRWFYFNGMTCTTPRYYLDSRCELMESGQDWYGKDERGGWVGKDISNLPGYGGYYPHKHCVEAGTRADKCPLVEVQEPHGRLVDADVLMNVYIKNEFCSDMGDAMEVLDNFPTVIEAEGE